jgi:hypothetical protein
MNAVGLALSPRKMKGLSSVIWLGVLVKILVGHDVTAENYLFINYSSSDVNVYLP